MGIADIATVVLPLVVPVLVGWGLVRVHLARPSDAGVLVTLFLWVCAPAALISTLASEDLDDLLEGRLLGGTVVVFVAAYAAVYAVFRLVLGRASAVAAFAAFSTSGLNALAIGLPVMLGMFGSLGAVPAVVGTVVFLGVMVPITLVLVAEDSGDERDASDGGRGPDDTAAQGRRRIFLGALATTARNPIVVATAVGLVLAALDVGLPDVVDQSLVTLGDATVLTALVALGLTLDVGDIRRGSAEVLWLSAVRVVVVPAAALALALAFGTNDVQSAAFVILFALPTAKTVFVLAEQTGVYVRSASAIVTLTTVSSVVVLPVWITVCDHVWPSAFT